MRTLLSFLFSVVLLSACTTVAPYVEQIRIFDYNKYYRQGIFITEANTVPFDYEPIGSLNLCVRNGEDTKGKEVYGSQYIDFWGHVKNVPEAEYEIKAYRIDSVMQILCNNIKKLNGDGIMNFNLSFNDAEESSGVIKLESCTIKGMVFKRK